MFHTYIINAVGTKIDIDRAGYLMDDELAAEALAQVETDWPDWLYRDLSLPGVVPPPNSATRNSDPRRRRPSGPCTVTNTLTGTTKTSRRTFGAIPCDDWPHPWTATGCQHIAR